MHATFTGALGEITFDTDLKTLRAHDGAQLGGYILLRMNADGSIALGNFNISADGSTLTHTSANANFKIKNGQILMWDQAAYNANPALPYRALGCNNGSTIFSDPIAG